MFQASKKFSTKEIEDIKKTFKSFDKNGDGTISIDELEQVEK